MFDINAIVNAAIATAVEARITEVLQQHANTVGALEQRLAVLSNLVQCIDTDRVRLTERIATLENNPAQGVELGAANVQRELDDEIMGIKQRLGALEDKDEETLDSDDVEAMIEQAIGDHCSTYDHDDYDRAVSAIDDVDLEDIITSDNLSDAINEALSGATVSISV